MARLELATAVIEVKGDYPSPSVLVNGRDVMGDPATTERACRCDLPTEKCVLTALRVAMGEAQA